MDDYPPPRYNSNSQQHPEKGGNGMGDRYQGGFAQSAGPQAPHAPLLFNVYKSSRIFSMVSFLFPTISVKSNTKFLPGRCDHGR